MCMLPRRTTNLPEDFFLFCLNLILNVFYIVTGYPSGAYYPAPYPTADWRSTYPYSTPVYLAQYQFNQLHPSQPYVPYMVPTRKSEVTNKDDPHAPTINGVIEQVTAELKQILKRDFNKKMVENTAFKKFESWWDEQEQSKHKVGNV